MWVGNYWIKLNSPIEIYKTTRNFERFKNRCWAWCFYFHRPTEFCITINKPKVWLLIENVK